MTTFCFTKFHGKDTKGQILETCAKLIRETSASEIKLFGTFADKSCILKVVILRVSKNIHSQMLGWVHFHPEMYTLVGDRSRPWTDIATFTLPQPQM